MVTVSAGARPAKPAHGQHRTQSSAPRRRRPPPPPSAIAPVDRVLMRFSREHLAGFIEVAIDLLDLADANPSFRLPCTSIELGRDSGADLGRHGHPTGRQFETGDTIMDINNASAAGATAQQPSNLLLKLAERNALIDRIDIEDLSDLEAAEESARLSRQDAAILATPAASSDDMFAKLLLLVQSVTEGVMLEEADAAAAVLEAQALTGAGRVSPNVVCAKG